MFRTTEEFDAASPLLRAHARARTNAKSSCTTCTSCTCVNLCWDLPCTSSALLNICWDLPCTWTFEVLGALRALKKTKENKIKQKETRISITSSQIRNGFIWFYYVFFCFWKPAVRIKKKVVVNSRKRIFIHCDCIIMQFLRVAAPRFHAGPPRDHAEPPFFHAEAPREYAEPPFQTA